MPLVRKIHSGILVVDPVVVFPIRSQDHVVLVAILHVLVQSVIVDLVVVDGLLIRRLLLWAAIDPLEPYLYLGS